MSVTTSIPTMAASNQTRWQTLARIIGGFAVIYGVFDGTARLLPHAGLIRPLSFYIISALVIVTAFLVDRVVFKQSFAQSAQGLGLGRPVWAAVGVAIIIGCILQLGYPLLTALTGAQFPWPSNWLLMFLGVFMMNGIAEEMMVRGFLFRRLRATRTFWRAVAWVALLHGAAHIPIMLETGPLVGGVAVFVAVATGIPFAYMFERGGHTIWAPAILHFAADTVLVLIPPTAMSNPMMQIATVGWLLIIAIAPYLIFLWRPVTRQPVVAESTRV